GDHRLALLFDYRQLELNVGQGFCRDPDVQPVREPDGHELSLLGRPLRNFGEIPLPLEGSGLAGKGDMNPTAAGVMNHHPMPISRYIHSIRSHSSSNPALPYCMRFPVHRQSTSAVSRGVWKPCMAP